MVSTHHNSANIGISSHLVSSRYLQAIQQSLLVFGVCRFFVAARKQERVEFCNTLELMAEGGLVTEQVHVTILHLLLFDQECALLNLSVYYSRHSFCVSLCRGRCSVSQRTITRPEVCVHFP